MCGICGELRFDGAPAASDVVARMADTLAYRGPDDAGAYSDGPLALGHRRLAIIDLSHRGHQPMVDNALDLALVFNGVIYNYRELRGELADAGYQFFSDSDTEVILKAYHAWGERCTERLSGMFAFAVWDRRCQHLFLARDRIGIKPLYYTIDRNRLRFASNTQALLAGGGVDTEIDPVALHHHLTLHAVVPAPRTVLRGVRKLAPATSVSIDLNGRRTPRTYWSLQARRPVAPRSETEWTEAVHEALERAVRRRRLAADVPVGVLLSGGLDSSLLVAMLDEAGHERVLTYSVGFEDTPEEAGSEFEYSDAVAARYATDHHKFHIPNRQLLERLPEAVGYMAEPMVGQDAVAFYLLAEQVSQSVKVVQSGQGADEAFGGYFWYPLMHEAEGSDLERFSPYYFDRGHDEFLETVTTPYHGFDYTSGRIRTRLERAPGDEFIDRVLHMDVTTLIVDDPVKRVDNMTMACALEARVPFLDHELVEVAAAMPPALKLEGGGKAVLKRIARGRLPDSVIDRPKGYFPVPALKYVRGRFLAFMREILDSPTAHRRGLFNRSYIERLLADPEAHLTPLQGSKLWHAALLELWLQRVVDGVAA